MNRIWFHFSKMGLAACLSHLDTIRTLERACRRAQLPLAYSQGFNPRPRLAFGPALPVGMESEAEFFEAQMHVEYAPLKAASELNHSLPAGLRVIKASQVAADVPSLSSLVAAAHYRALLPKPAQSVLAQAVSEVLHSEEWIIERPKKGKRDVRPLLHALELTGNRELHFTLASGQDGTLRPDDFLTALAHECHDCFNPVDARITRMGLLIKGKEGLGPFDKYF